MQKGINFDTLYSFVTKIIIHQLITKFLQCLKNLN